MKKTWAAAWGLYKKKFGSLLLLTVIELLLILITISPALFLSVPKGGIWALLVLPMIVLLLLPARQNLARVLQNGLRTDEVDLQGLVSLDNYGEKLAAGLKTSCFILLWALPFLAATALAALVYGGNVVDVFTLLRMIMNLGKSAAANLLFSCFDSDTLRGVAMLMVLYVLTALPLLFGCAFHSWNRHGNALNRDRKLIRGHRGGLLLTWLLGLLTAIPFGAVLCMVSVNYLRALVKAVSNFTNGIVLPPIDGNIYLIAGAFAVLLLPLIPLRLLLTAAYVHGLDREDA